jgi:hypothetical protein
MELNEKEKSLLDAVEIKVKETSENLIKEAIKNASSKADIELLRSEIQKMDKTELVEKMNKRLDEMEVLLKEKKSGMEGKSFKEQLLEHLNIDAVRNDIKSNRPVKLELKANMSMTGSTTGQAGRVQFAPGINFEPLRGLMLSGIIPEYPTESNAVFYLDATSPVGAPAFINDSEEAPNKSWTFVQKTAAVKDISVHSVYSQNMVDDIENFASQIDQRLFNELMDKYDEKLYNGASTGTDEFDGLTFYASAFAVADASLKTSSPNLRDVLNASCAQVEAANGHPNFVLLNPVDFRALKNKKLTTGEYALPWDISPVLMVDGLFVIANTGVTMGEFLVGDSTKGEQHIRQAFTINIDPYTLSTQRGIRVTLTKRAAFLVRTNDATSFVKGNIATAITSLTAV